MVESRKTRNLIETLSFKDLSLLSTMMTERNLSAAARSMNVSQSTASYGLEKLRAVFSDKLFVRRGHDWVATSKGEQLAELADQSLRNFSELTKEQIFDPMRSERSFVILCQGPDMRVFDYFVPRLYEKAPQVGIEFRVVPPGQVDHELHHGADIYLGADLGASPGIGARSGLLSPIKLIFNPDFVEPPYSDLDMNNLRFATHPAIGTPAGAKGVLDLEMERRNLPPLNYALRTSSLPRIASTLRVSDIVFPMPFESIPISFKGLAHADLPFEVKRLKYSVRWSISKQADPGLLWIRDLADECFRMMPGDGHANKVPVTLEYGKKRQAR